MNLTNKDLHFLAECIKEQYVRKNLYKLESNTIKSIFNVSDSMIVEKYIFEAEGPIGALSRVLAMGASKVGLLRPELQEIYSKVSHITSKEDLLKVTEEIKRLKVNPNLGALNKARLESLQEIEKLGESKLRILNYALQMHAESLRQKIMGIGIGTYVTARNIAVINEVNGYLTQSEHDLTNEKYLAAKERMDRVNGIVQPIVRLDEGPGNTMAEVKTADHLTKFILGVMITSGSLIVIKLLYPIAMKLINAARNWYRGSHLRSMISSAYNFVKNILKRS